MLTAILIIHALLDIVLLTFLVKQYKMLIDSTDYKNESLLNKFIVGGLVILAICFVLALIIFSAYYAFV